MERNYIHSSKQELIHYLQFWKLKPQNFAYNEIILKQLLSLFRIQN